MYLPKWTNDWPYLDLSTSTHYLFYLECPFCPCQRTQNPIPQTFPEPSNPIHPSFLCTQKYLIFSILPELFLLYWNWCSYRLEMGVSGKLWIVVKVVIMLYMMWNERYLWIQWRGNVLHLELIWGTPINFAFLRWHQCSSRLVTVLLGTL